ncbi:MAG: thioredoxin family protein [Myxococcota bacterium]
MILLVLSSLGLAAEGDGPRLPGVTASVRRGTLNLTVQPPAGEHINRDGPFSATIEVGDQPMMELAGAGAALTAGLLLPADDQVELWGRLSVPLCEDGGVACRTAEVVFDGLPGRRPTMLSVSAPQPTEAAPHLADVDAAFAMAKETGRLVLLDFGAVWCPPCNLLNAEVLDDPEDAEALAPFVIARVDVDRFESWAIKDRYSVGGYPTMVLARPDGTEVDRMIGYPGEAAVFAWLASGPEQTPIGELPEVGTVSADEAAAIARRLSEQGMDGLANIWLNAAEDASDKSVLNNEDVRITRLNLRPAVEDARWLLDHQVPVADWAFTALPLIDDDPVFAASLHEALVAALARAEGAEAADLLYALANTVEEPAQKAAFYAAAASTLQASMTGEAFLDRGQWTYLARLYERAGQEDLALGVLENGVALYPEEFTFHYALAGMMLRMQRPADAVAAGQKAQDHGYGDNRLRAAKRLAEALRADGRFDDAIAVIDQALDVERPAEEMNVRTPRYLKALEDLREELVDEVAAQTP